MKIRCLKCNDVIEAVYSRDFKKCKCEACFIDYGNEHTRLGGNLKDIMLVNDDGIDEQMTLEKLNNFKNK